MAPLSGESLPLMLALSVVQIALSIAQIALSIAQMAGKRKRKDFYADRSYSL